MNNVKFIRKQTQSQAFITQWEILQWSSGWLAAKDLLIDGCDPLCFRRETDTRRTFSAWHIAPQLCSPPAATMERLSCGMWCRGASCAVLSALRRRKSNAQEEVISWSWRARIPNKYPGWFGCWEMERDLHSYIYCSAGTLVCLTQPICMGLAAGLPPTGEFMLFSCRRQFKSNIASSAFSLLCHYYCTGLELVHVFILSKVDLLNNWLKAPPPSLTQETTQVFQALFSWRNANCSTSLCLQPWWRLEQRVSYKYTN